MLLVGGWSCGETNTGISVCSSNVGSTLLIMYFCVLCVYFLPIPLGAWSILCQRHCCLFLLGLDTRCVGRMQNYDN